jgi:hypothetical protein
MFVRQGQSEQGLNSGRVEREVSDFRRVYATVLEDWLGLPGEPALGEAFERLPLFRT